MQEIQIYENQLEIDEARSAASKLHIEIQGMLINATAIDVGENGDLDQINVLTDDDARQ